MFLLIFKMQFSVGGPLCAPFHDFLKKPLETPLKIFKMEIFRGSRVCRLFRKVKDTRGRQEKEDKKKGKFSINSHHNLKGRREILKQNAIKEIQQRPAGGRRQGGSSLQVPTSHKGCSLEWVFASYFCGKDYVERDIPKDSGEKDDKTAFFLPINF